MELWTTLAELRPDALPALIVGGAVFLIASVVIYRFLNVRWDDLGDILPSIAFGLLIGLMAAAASFAAFQVAATSRSQDAIETHLATEHEIRTLGAITIDNTERTASASGVDAEGRRVEVALQWLRFDAQDDFAALGDTQTFEPLTITVTVTAP